MFFHQQGFTLIEVLVTMVILAVGLLGIAALQLRGLQFNHDAHLRSQASALAYDIADRIRLAGNHGAEYAEALPASVTCDPGVVVKSQADAQKDLKCWQDLVAEALPPNSTGSSALIEDVSGNYTITLRWEDREGALHDITYTFFYKP